MQEHPFFFTAYPDIYTDIIRRTLSPNEQSIYNCFLDVVFGSYRSESEPVDLEADDLKYHANVRTDREIDDALRMLCAYGLLEKAEGGYMVKLGMLRELNDTRQEHGFRTARKQYIDGITTLLESELEAADGSDKRWAAIVSDRYPIEE